MRLALLAVFFMSLPLFAEESISFKNDREGKSVYSATKTITRTLRQVRSEEIISSFNGVLEGMKERQLCAYTLNDALMNKLRETNPRFTELEGAIHHLREKNEIDDVVVKILLKAQETMATYAYYSSHHNDGYDHRMDLPRDRKKQQEMVEIIATFKEKYLSRSCYDEAFRMLVSDLNKALSGVRSRQLGALFIEAYERRMIDHNIYQLLEKARLNELEKNSLDLKGYYAKIKMLRTQYPLRDSNEKSEFVTQRVDKHSSRRQKLLENYSELQIIMMGNVIKKLRSRLESPRIEILIYNNDSVEEIIPLEPMERFRFAIKILRKEMVQLSMNTYFGGRSPEYLDLMTAAYEIGLVPAVELEEIAGLQDIWNPKKTFWEKASVWVKAFGGVATVVIPPPYGFIPALAIVVIEATVGKKDVKPENMDLF